jgi:hypothetical protein
MRFGRTVKGAPYSAEVITESTQTLADGTKINRQTKAPSIATVRAGLATKRP